jgi:hypothetical protein
MAAQELSGRATPPPPSATAATTGDRATAITSTTPGSSESGTAVAKRRTAGETVVSSRLQAQRRAAAAAAVAVAADGTQLPSLAAEAGVAAAVTEGGKTRRWGRGRGSAAGAKTGDGLKRLKRVTQLLFAFMRCDERHT